MRKKSKTQNRRRKQTEKPDNLFATKADSSICSQHDNINRLTDVGGSNWTGLISYNGAGNITSQRFGTSTLNYNYDGSNRLGSVSGSRVASYGYDAYGNVISAAGNAYAYDGAPNLRCVNCADAAKMIEYSYDATNHRSSVTKNGVKTYEMYGSNGNLLIEFTPSWSNRLVENIYLGGKRIAAKTSPNTLPVPTLTVSRTPMMTGLAFTVTWATTNATEVSYACIPISTGGYADRSVLAHAPNDGISGVTNPAWINITSTCTWTATGPGGTKTVVETVTPIAPIKPTLTTSRTPSPMLAGLTFALTWATTNATAVSYNCTASGTGYIGSSGALALNASANGTALNAWIGFPSTCTWTATGPAGNTIMIETMTTVAPAAPTLTVNRTPSPMMAGQSYMLTWTSTNANTVSYTCTAAGTGYAGSSGALAPNGSSNATALSAWIGYPSTCTWTAAGPGGTKTLVETMTTVVSPAPTLSVNLTPSPMKARQAYALAWASTNTNTNGVSYSCTASGTGYKGSSGPLASNGSLTGVADVAWVGFPSTCTWTASGPGGSKTVVTLFETSNTNNWLPPVIWLLLGPD